MGPTMQALRYVHNTGGGATKDHFVEDFEPIGQHLWDQLSEQGYVRTRADGKIELTEAGDRIRLESTRV